MSSFWRLTLQQRGLIVSMVRREIASRYQGTAAGWLWALAQPLVTLTVYTVVFGLILKVRWSNTGGTFEFAMVLFAGLMVFGFVADVLTRAPMALVANPNYVKKVVFPLQVLVWQLVGAATFQLLVNLVMWMAFYLLLMQQAHWSWFWLPILAVPLTLFTLGLSLALAAVGVFIRDLAQAIGPVMMVGLYLSPVFYSGSMVPPQLHSVMRLNPLAPIIEQWRAVLFGQAINWADVGLFTLWALLALTLGVWFFERTRPGFADVL